MSLRRATHAGSWYSDRRGELAAQLAGWLDRADECCGAARAIIAPHAGFYFSGETAAWAYKHVAPVDVRRVFILGPSHHHYTPRCAVSACRAYATPLGEMHLDREVRSPPRHATHTNRRFTRNTTTLQRLSSRPKTGPTTNTTQSHAGVRLAARHGRIRRDGSCGGRGGALDRDAPAVRPMRVCIEMHFCIEMHLPYVLCTSVSRCISVSRCTCCTSYAFLYRDAFLYVR